MKNQVQISPTSTAGILLREHDNLDQALAYARRTAEKLAQANNTMAQDYQQAATELSRAAAQAPA